MNQEPLRRLVRALRQSTDSDGGSPDDDARLLRRFLEQGDANAFELLLWRHGPMVLGVCQRVLGDAHDAEDAFQATFLTLLKKGHSITAGAALGSWLYRVAYRAGLRLRTSLARRARREQSGVEEIPAPAARAPVEGEFRAVLDEEVNRLPARHRAAFVLCCLEGKSGAEAARELGCPAGTISSRLTRAREQLRRRLARRGLAPSVAALTAGLASDAGAASLPPRLVKTTLEAARLFAKGAAAGGALSQQAITVAEGVIRAMSLSRLKLATLLLLLTGLLTAGVVFSRPGPGTASAGEVRQEASAPQPQNARSGEAGKEVAPAIEVVKPHPGGLKRTLRERCTVRPFERADLVAPVAGFLKGQTVDIGTVVKKGEVLAELDVPLLALQEKQAITSLKQAQTQVREAQARVAAAVAEVRLVQGGVKLRQAELDNAKAALTYQQAVLDRFKRLADTGAIDARLLEEKQAQVLAARAKVASETAAVENAKADVPAKEARLSQAEAALESTRFNVEMAEIALQMARARISQTRIVAPFDGVVTRRNHNVGEYIRSGEQAGQLPLLTVDRIDRLRAVGEISERDVPFVEIGMPVEVSLNALPGVRLQGKIARTGFAVDEKTRTMRVEIDLANAKGELRPGMFGAATMHLQNKAPGVVLIPATAIAGSNSPRSEAGVFVMRDGKPHLTRVVTGFQQGSHIEILSGLAPTDLVARYAVSVVRPGGKDKRKQP
jgi:RND family efflux transporter MFP subunit